jgi:phenylpropionate dioxygenase-like ring-hydroxylating dioxygenase large terminal subunit
LRCPYHGWKFANDGQCVEIPSVGSEQSKVMSKARLHTYAVQEKYGLVWLFYGDLPAEERPTIPPLPEYDDPAFQHISLDVQFNTHYTRVIENALCPAHLSTVHAKSFGAAFAEDQRVLPYQVKSVSGGLTAQMKYPKVTKPKGIFKLFFRSSYTEINSRTTFYLPNITIVESDFIRGKMVNYAIHIPVDERHTVSKRMQFRNVLTHPWLDKLFVDFHIKVCEEDRLVCESQRPMVVPENYAEEVHVASDAMPLAYRRLCEAHEYEAISRSMEEAQIVC